MAPRPFGGTSLGPTGDRDVSPRPWWFGGGSGNTLSELWSNVVVIVSIDDLSSLLVVMAYCKRGDTVYSSLSSGTASTKGSTTSLLVEVVVLLVLVSDGCCSTTDVRLRVDRRVGMGGGSLPLPLGRFVRREADTVVRRRS